MSESNSDNLKNSSNETSLGTVTAFAKDLEDRANEMETHGWIKEAADLRKWALELRAYIASQSFSPER
jgi:hypothetical protein